MPDPPIVARTRVAVLLRGEWTALNARLQREAELNPESNALYVLDGLIEAATPVFAQQALQAHILANAGIYQRFGVHAWAFHLLAPEERHAMTIWGELQPEDVILAVREALARASQARAKLPDLPADIFWPLTGAFFSVPNNSPQISAQTWAHLEAFPRQYTVLELLMTSYYGEVSPLVLESSAALMADHSVSWRLCLRCGRATRSDEGVFWDNRQFCPHWCGGEIA